MSRNNRRKPVDHFGLDTGDGSPLKITESNENRSMQSGGGQNTPGDTVVADAWGETAAPSCVYDVVKELAHDPAAPATTLITLGDLIAAADSGITIGGTSVPVVRGSLSISTQMGRAPSVTVTGQAVQAGAKQLRRYKIPAFLLTSRHRAQDFLGLMSIKKGQAAVEEDGGDYGLSSVNANFPIAFTLAQPQGTLANYDLHGDMATADFTMNWYDDTEPTIELTAAANALGATMSTPKSKSVPRDGYVQYTWQVSFPMVGEEVEQE